MAARTSKASDNSDATEKAVVSTPGKITEPAKKEPTVKKTGNGTVVRSY